MRKFTIKEININCIKKTIVELHDYVKLKTLYINLEMIFKKNKYRLYIYKNTHSNDYF